MGGWWLWSCYAGDGGVVLVVGANGVAIRVMGVLGWWLVLMRVVRGW